MTDYAQDKEVSLSEILRLVLACKYILIGAFILSGVLSVSLALYLPNLYKSDTTLVVSNSSENGLNAMSSGLGGLAGLAGINLNSGKSAKNAVIAQQLLQSKNFIIDFVKRHELEVPLMATVGWDKTNNSLIYDEEIYSFDEQAWKIGDLDRAPLSIELYNAFMDILTFNEDNKTGLIKVSIEFYSAPLAKAWLENLIIDVNKKIQKQDLAQTQENLEYLNVLVANTQESSLKQTFYKIIEEETKTLLLAELEEEYVYQIVDAPLLAEKKSAPRRMVIVIVGTALGGTTISMFVLAFFAYRRLNTV